MRRHGRPRGDLQPLGVLVEHRVDDVDERLVAVEQPVPPGEQVALEPALALMLAEHLHHAPARREELVVRHGGRVPLALWWPRRPPRGRWRASRPGRRCGNCAARAFSLRHVAQEASEHMRIADARAPRAWARRPRSRGNPACAGRAAASRRWHAGSRPCAARPVGASSASSGLQAAAAHRTAPPADSCAASPRAARRCSGCVGGIGERHLVRAKGALDRHAIDELRTGPALGRVEHDHRPARPRGVAMLARVVLNALDLLDDRVERRGHRLVHQARARDPRRSRGSQP